MGKKIILIFVTASVTLFSGCCLRFSDLPADATYNVGDTITTSGTDIKVEQFQWAGGSWTSSGRAKVDTRNYSRGSGKDLNSGNVNLRFMFGYPLDRITLKFGELGGNNNIKVNDDFSNIGDLISLNGTALGGAHLTVNAVQQGNNWYGKMTIDGNIDNFSIGGQELWLDDVCPFK
jgi:hypothetical protein